MKNRLNPSEENPKTITAEPGKGNLAAALPQPGCAPATVFPAMTYASPQGSFELVERAAAS